MKLNKKGFTLIELLAVVVILLAISVIAVSSISAAIERNKVKQDDAKKEVIEGYAKLYYDANKNRLEREIASVGSGCIDLNITDLGLSEEERIDSNGDTFNGCVIFETNGKSFKYVNRAEDASDCCN